jgi:hypothetical protein
MFLGILFLGFRNIKTEIQNPSGSQTYVKS